MKRTDLMNAGFTLKLILLALVLLLPAGAAFAADITVDATCTLAQAINEANEDTTDVGSCEAGTDGSGAAGADTIILSANATVSAQLPTITTHVTIRGGSSVPGFAIELSRASHIETSADSNLTLENITLNQGATRSAAKAALELGGPATLTQVRIVSSSLLGIRAKGEDAVYSFTNLLIESTSGSWGWPSAFWVEEGQATVTNLGIANMSNGSAMIQVSSGAELTLEGCKTISEVLNKRITGAGTFTDNSSGPCSGPIGNGSSIPNRPVENPPPASACGFPAPTGNWVNVPDDAGLLKYELSGDCVLTGPLYIPSGVRMIIRSPARQRYTITAAINNKLIVNGGELTLINVELATSASDDFAGQIILQVVPPGKLLMRNSIIRRPDGATVARAGVLLSSVEATFEDVTFRNLASSFSWLSSALFAQGRSKVTVRGSTFRDNSGGPAAITFYHDLEGYIRMLGNTFSDNTPKDIHDPHGRICRGAACFPRPAPPATPTPPPPSTAILATCPAPPGSGKYGLIGSASWRGHYARLGIQAQGNQAGWAAGDAGVSGINYCFWDYECSTAGHWAYGAYHAKEGHTYLAPGTRPPAAVGRSGGKFNLCYSAWENGCNSTEAWDFGYASGKQIFEEYLHQRVTAAGGC